MTRSASIRVKTAKGLLVGAALLALADCAGRYLPVNDAGQTTAAAPKGAVASMPANTPDTCGAGKLQYLVGKSRFQIPVPANLNSQRVACNTCVRADQFDPHRITILYDEPTGLVTKVLCQ